MYEVEVMLGETDETHIIRTIEYWDNEKRRWPQRQHYAVLVAESINRRFFNVIHLLSHSIPIIAIQASLVESTIGRTLFFSKILDTYEEIDDGIDPNERYDEQFWQSKSPWTLETAQLLYRTLSDQLDEPELNYVKNYVSLTAHGNNYFWLRKRSANKSLLEFRIPSDLLDEATAVLDQNNIPYGQKKRRLILTVDKTIVEKNREMFVILADMVKKRWQA